MEAFTKNDALNEIESTYKSDLEFILANRSYGSTKLILGLPYPDDYGNSLNYHYFTPGEQYDLGEFN